MNPSAVVLSVGQVGQQQYPDGNQVPPRLGQQAETIVSQLHGRYYEQCYRKNLFVMDSDSITLAAAHTTKGALATVKLINGFFNPLTSKVNAVILMARVATVSGTPGGPYFYNFLQDSTINSAATGTARSLNLAAPATSQMTAQVNVILADTGGATTALKQLAVLGGPAAIAAGAGLYSANDEPCGMIIVPPGVVFGICALAAGTTHVVQSTLIWEEVPV
jgi:hypothetical protein